MGKLFAVLTAAMLIAANTVIANTVDSSTMVFEGILTDHGNGSYSGNIIGTADFDVYAKIGSVVTSPASTIDGGMVGSDHDAYPNWPVDVPDVIGTDGGYYALHLDGINDTWALWYLAVRYDPDSGPASYNGDIYDPFAGTVDWTGGYADETGRNWQQTWTWGYENVELQYTGFNIDIVETLSAGGGVYIVTLTPAPEPATLCILCLGGLFIRRRRNV